MVTAIILTIMLLPKLAKAYGGDDPLKLAHMFHFDQQARVPVGPMLIVWVLFLWRRGVQFGNAYLTLVRASFGLRLGILSILVIAVIGSAELRNDMLAVVPFFFLFGLYGASLARADSLNLDASGRQSPFGRGWMLALLMVSTFVTFGGYLLAHWLSGTEIGYLQRTLGIIGEGVLTVFFLLLSPILLALQVIYDIARAKMPDEFVTPLTSRRDASNSNGGTSVPWLADLFVVLGDVLVVALVISVILILLAFIWFLLVARGRRQEYEDEERETLGAGEVIGGFRRSLRDSWRRLADTLGLLRQFGGGHGLLAALTIRRMYARMEKLASARGYPRTPSETPYEFYQQLHHAFPGQGQAVQCITEAYVAVRYGNIPEDRSELAKVRLAWHLLRDSPEPM
jgi:hypothetical protein